MPQLAKEAEHLKPLLQSYGATVRSSSEAGGWNLAVVKKGRAASTFQATFNSSADAYRSLMAKPLTKQGQSLRTKVVLPKGPRVMFGATTGGIDSAVDALTTMIVMKELRDVAQRQRRDRIEEDVEVASAAAQAAQQAGARMGTRVRQRTLTKRKFAGRVRIHGYSRRHGQSTRDFKRKSPRR